MTFFLLLIVFIMDPIDTSYADYLALIKYVRAQTQVEVEHLTRPDAPPLSYRIHTLPRCCCCFHVQLQWYYPDAGIQQASACALVFGALMVHAIVYGVVGTSNTVVWWSLFAMYCAIALWQLLLYNALVRLRPRTVPVRIKRNILLDGDNEASDINRLPSYETYQQAMSDIRERCVAEFASIYIDQLVAQRVRTVKEIVDEPLDKILARYDR